MSKKIISLPGLKKNKLRDFYKAGLLNHPEFKLIEYQCSREELKTFKRLVAASFILEVVSYKLKKKKK